MKFHPLADLFPLIEGADFEALVADIKANGQREPVIIYHDMILDGRNRWRACHVAGLRPITKEYEGDDPVGLVISLNLRRRHLDESQRGLVAAKLATLQQGRPGKAANLPVIPTQADAANLLNVSERTVRSARTVLDKGAPELVKAVENGKLSISQAAVAARLSREKQEAIAQEASAGRANSVRATIKRETRGSREAELGAAQAAGNLALPDAPRYYGVILADPEWRFEVYSRETGMDRAADNHYPTSTTELIASRPVAKIAADDCVLFLWATSPMILDALHVMEAWGFKYKSQIIWDKMGEGTGYWFRNMHELLLVGTRGKIPAPAPGTQWGSIHQSPRGAHSEKPDWQYELIEQYFPTLPKIELNARRVRDGWTAWGLDAPAKAMEAAE